ncbi:Rotamer strain As A determinant of protein structural specificity [Fimicolochytrium jonesii]|uniref:Rotamer strain As A determinant of protein structural specificity n=1 Tax=Fimicolochytrium jonesii TaxID=1396493 RepID=UPI0022FDEF2C|nr:Rotamer strain As A determinant of protein structural specificity [Fimicolochytrium jonesii]KAI8816590.1 Rotamer strain As A determinant of protein structural specificity [Fimicolochytrium jonesii]
MTSAGKQTEPDNTKGRLFVQNLHSKKFAVDLSLRDKVRDVKAQIRHHWGLAEHTQAVIFAGKQMTEDDRMLFEYGLEFGSIMYLVCPLPGGV